LDLDDANYKQPDVWPDSLDLPLPEIYRDAVISSLVFVHKSVGEANKQLLKQGKHNYLTPRHYLDFINHFVHLIGEKRDELEEQQLHLNIGLQKLYDTEKQVKELQQSLATKNQELEAKNNLANEKLKQMVEDQQVAEQKKKDSTTLQTELDQQNSEIQVRKKKAYEDLEKVEPAIEEAKEAVGGIKRQHLDEIKTLAKPPAPVQLAMEAVCFMLHGKQLDWAQIRRSIVEAGFIPSIVGFDSKRITPKMRLFIDKNYLEDPKFTFETVNRASKACGPLVKWVTAQMMYSEILDRVQPLRQEIDKLEDDANILATQQSELQGTIQDLEKAIGGYKDEYAILIRDAEMIKSELQRVKEKVERSISLLQKLSSESGRWETQRQTFQSNMSTIIGDVLLSSAFLAYIGFFDQNLRTQLMKKWMFHLDNVGVVFKQELSVVEYLSSPDERLTWQSNSLPVDDLCMENAIMLQRFNRYPLVIDPSGQAAEFLMNQYRDKKVTKTSFLDSSFMKNLESALRFGTPLIVNDVESIDPVLNPVLNKEIHKKGGRVLIKLGDQEVDFSPSFVIFLITRDPSSHFTPDLCSRVTFVNFTVTPGSLQSQCMHQVLKTESPDVYLKQQSLIKAQGEFKVKLRNLEKSLLKALNESTGNILDDDKIIGTLETLKSEAADIMAKVQETDVIMEEIYRVSASYNNIGSACSRIYFAIDQLDQIHFLYRFSLKFFLEIFNGVLHHNPNLVNIKDPQMRLRVLQSDLFHTVFRRVTRGLLHQDHIPFALRLAQIQLKGTPQEPNEEEQEFLLRGGDSFASTPSLADSFQGFSAVQSRMTADMTLIDAFKNIPNHILSNKDQWNNFLHNPTAETMVPTCWEGKEDLEEQQRSQLDSFRRLLVLKALRPDRIAAGAAQFVSEVFGEDMLNTPETDLGQVVEKEATCDEPLFFCSMPGFDPSVKVDNLAAKYKKTYKSLAMGSDEGFDLAEKTIAAAAKGGSWVLLKNVHLAPSWLLQLEKKLHNLTPHTNFRLFMTSEIHPKLPANLLRMSQVFVFEPPPGVKANLQHTLAGISSQRMDRAPVERSRLYFLEAWFHAVIQERLRYAPLGWSKMFEFNEADQRVALDTIDYWIDQAAQGKSNLAPERIPWVALRTLLGQTVYGGRIDNEFDQRLLDSFLKQLFTEYSFDVNFPLFRPSGSQSSLTIPDGKSKQDFVNWVEQLPNTESPVWLGLPENAEVLLLTRQGQTMLRKLLRLQSATQEEMVDEIEESKTTESGDAKRPAWARTLSTTLQAWRRQLPDKLDILERTAASVKDPLFRFFEREIEKGVKLLSKVHRDVEDLIQICDGTLKPTNYTRELISNINKGVVPKSWKEYSVPSSISLNGWVQDLTKRVKQMKTVGEQKNGSYGRGGIWVGGLFHPEAFITATRQAAAQAHGWSVENLTLTMEILQENVSTVEPDTFIAKDLVLESASWSPEEQCLVNTDETSSALPLARFRWKNEAGGKIVKGKEQMIMPVYLNELRSEFIFSVPVKIHNGEDEGTSLAWAQRAPAIIAWST